MNQTYEDIENLINTQIAEVANMRKEIISLEDELVKSLIKGVKIPDFISFEVYCNFQCIKVYILSGDKNNHISTISNSIAYKRNDSLEWHLKLNQNFSNIKQDTNNVKTLKRNLNYFAENVRVTNLIIENVNDKLFLSTQEKIQELTCKIQNLEFKIEEDKDLLANKVYEKEQNMLIDFLTSDKTAKDFLDTIQSKSFSEGSCNVISFNEDRFILKRVKITIEKKKNRTYYSKENRRIGKEKLLNEIKNIVCYNDVFIDLQRDLPEIILNNSAFNGHNVRYGSLTKLVKELSLLKNAQNF